ncbi:hypothetical protein NPIL_582961 [Nephila pilipes]|uniref:Uncharacterized protein n=1 Tax=Nephila pilipes TaxID=299642 RepID=A0A8X6PD82_NEPPI|nr:hypothetical protein NPIL_582961 [Nephila pilipes]
MTTISGIYAKPDVKAIMQWTLPVGCSQDALWWVIWVLESEIRIQALDFQWPQGLRIAQAHEIDSRPLAQIVR